MPCGASPAVTVSVTLQLSPIRRRFLEFLVAVAAVHVVAITIYYAADLQHATPTGQRWFAWLWMGATVFVVVAGLQRIKRARRGRRLGAPGNVKNGSVSS